MTTYQHHARIQRKIVNMDAQGDRFIVCGWDDCERPGFELYKLLLHDHPVNRGCNRADTISLAAGTGTAHRWVPFCCERHRLYYANAQGVFALRSLEASGRAYGNLPPGSRGTIL